MEKKLKHYFLDAIISGSLGKHTNRGIIVTTKEFVAHFATEDKNDYLRSYLPSVTMESGRTVMQHNKYLLKICRATYKVHPDAIEHHKHNHISI